MPRDASATRKRILAAAIEEFAAHGVAGARVDRIAENASANKRAIYEQFGDKAELFAIVLADQLDQLAQAVDLRPDRVPDYVGALFDYCAAHPQLVRLVQWEALSFAPEQAPNFAARSASYAAKVAVIAQAQQSGQITDRLPPERILLLLIGLAEWSLYTPQLARMILGDDAAGAADRAQHRDFLVTTARRLLDAT
jgi:AcrR family transcriptional regulator